MSDGGGDWPAEHLSGAANGEPEGLDAFPPEADALGLFSPEAETPAAGAAAAVLSAQTPADARHERDRGALVTQAHTVAGPAAQAIAVRSQPGVPAVAAPSHGALAVPAPGPQRAARTRKRPVLVSALVAVAVWGIGSLTSLWLERDRALGEPGAQSIADAPSDAATDLPLATPVVLAPPDDADVPSPEATAVTLTTMPGAAPPTPVRAEVMVRAAAVGPVPATAAATRNDGPAPLAAAVRPARVPAAPEPDAASARLDLSEDTVPAAAPESAAPALEPAAPVEAPVVAAIVVPAPVDRLTADREAIGSVLSSYRTSYNALDATSVSTIWQGLDTRALQRAFATLTRQTVSFDRCDVRVTGDDRAEARCRGLLTYVPKIGDGSAQQRRLAWNFEFQRTADRWLIANVSAR